MEYINAKETMKIYNLTNQNLNALVEITAKYMRSGAIVVLPTETCYGLAIDLTNKDAYDRLYKIKNRPENFKLPIVAANLQSATKYADISKKLSGWLAKHLPNSFTIITKANANFPYQYPDIGVRFSTNIFINKLAQELEGFALTSANINSLPETYSLKEVENQFAGKVFQPDIFINAGELAHVDPTTLIDFRDKKPKIIRQGLFNLK